jgi:hypothetical protein
MTIYLDLSGPLCALVTGRSASMAFFITCGFSRRYPNVEVHFLAHGASHRALSFLTIFRFSIYNAASQCISALHDYPLASKTPRKQI